MSVNYFIIFFPIDDEEEVSLSKAISVCELYNYNLPVVKERKITGSINPVIIDCLIYFSIVKEKISWDLFIFIYFMLLPEIFMYAKIVDFVKKRNLKKEKFAKRKKKNKTWRKLKRDFLFQFLKFCMPNLNYRYYTGDISMEERSAWWKMKVFVVLFHFLVFSHLAGDIYPSVFNFYNFINFSSIFL